MQGSGVDVSEAAKRKKDGADLDGHAFVFVGHFYVVHPDVRAPDVDAVERASIGAPNYHVIDLTVCARV